MKNSADTNTTSATQHAELRLLAALQLVDQAVARQSQLKKLWQQLDERIQCLQSELTTLKLGQKSNRRAKHS